MALAAWQTLLQGMMAPPAAQPDRIPQLSDIAWISTKPSLPPRRLIEDGETSALGGSSQAITLRNKPSFKREN